MCNGVGQLGCFNHQDVLMLKGARCSQMQEHGVQVVFEVLRIDDACVCNTGRLK
jgi:hypothetical protein